MPLPIYAETTYTVKADFSAGLRPTGPNSNFSIDLTVDPPTTDISGFSILVAYDTTSATLVSVTDNTTQPASGATYQPGALTPISGQPNVTHYNSVTMDASPPLNKPQRIARLNFQTTSSYNDPNKRFWLHLNSWGRFPASLKGLLLDSSTALPTEYQTPSNPQLVPVTLSSLSAD
jgi:hypothetical protein